MSLLFVLCLLPHKVLKTGNFAEVLLLFQQDAVTLKVGVFNALFAVIGQRVDGLLLLFVESDALLLVF